MITKHTKNNNKHSSRFNENHINDLEESNETICSTRNLTQSLATKLRQARPVILQVTRSHCDQQLNEKFY